MTYNLLDSSNKKTPRKYYVLKRINIKLTNKNSVKFSYKIIRSFFESGITEEVDYRFLNFISYKHKFTQQENTKI